MLILWVVIIDDNAFDTSGCYENANGMDSDNEKADDLSVDKHNIGSIVAVECDNVGPLPFCWYIQ